MKTDAALAPYGHVYRMVFYRASDVTHEFVDPRSMADFAPDAVGVAADAIGSGLDIMGRGFAPLGIVGPFAKMIKNRRESRLAAELVELWKLALADPALIEQACRRLTSR